MAAKSQDPLVRDLQAIRGRSWNRPESFQKLAELYWHPVVGHMAQDSPDPEDRVKALRRALRKTVTRMRAQEPGRGARQPRSPAAASEALLRLKPELASDEVTVPQLWKYVADRWRRRSGGGPVTPDTFRMHIADTQVYVPFAREFKRFAEEYADEHGIALGRGPDGWDFPPPPPELGSVARQLWGMEAARSKLRCDAIVKGALQPTDQEEMLAMLTMVTEHATTLEAVDHLTIHEWSVEGSAVRDYLNLQLARVQAGEVTLERIRLVSDEELEDPHTAEQLADFVELHDEAGAMLLLCQVEDAIEPFNTKTGMLLADRADEPTAVKGWIGDGQILNAWMYPPGSPSLDELVEAYRRLRAIVVGRRLDRRLRERLQKAQAG